MIEYLFYCRECRSADDLVRVTTKRTRTPAHMWQVNGERRVVEDSDFAVVEETVTWECRNCSEISGIFPEGDPEQFAVSTNITCKWCDGKVDLQWVESDSFLAGPSCGPCSRGEDPNDA